MTAGTQNQNPIPIGGLVPLTGASAADGAEFRNGVVLACEELNARGGILGRHLKPIFIDTGRQSAEEVVSGALRLIHEHRVHAIINGYNIGPQNSEYDVVADAGIIYINTNTLLQHHDTIQSNPERYFGCFMADPAEYWYGQGFIKFISWLRDTGQWKPNNNRLAIISGSTPYSIVIANAMASAAPQFGWTVAFGPEIVETPTRQWRNVLVAAKAAHPAVLANTHFYASDLASFHNQFMEAPINCLIYLQYGALHQSFLDLAGENARGVIVSAVIGLLRDEIGQRFAKRYISRFGIGSTPEIGCQSYGSMRHFALAAAFAGGTGAPGDFAQNARVARALRETPYRTITGTICYHPKWQAAIPYPDHVNDPSLGMPHLFYQVNPKSERPALIAPAPYNADKFIMPPWFETQNS